MNLSIDIYYIIMLVLIQHPHDWTIEPVVGEVWGRANLRVGGAIAVSSAHFKIVSVVDGECVCILHTGKVNGFVSRSSGSDELVKPGSEISLRVNDKYFFMETWRRIYFRVDDQDDLDAPTSSSSSSSSSEEEEEDDEEEKDAGKAKESEGGGSAATATSAGTATTTTTTALDREKEWIDPDDSSSNMSGVTAAAGAVVRAMFSRLKRQQQQPPPAAMSTTSLTSSSPTLLLVVQKSPHIPKLRKMMAARLKNVTSNESHDNVDRSCGFGVGSGFHSSTRIHNDIIPEPYVESTSSCCGGATPLPRKKKGKLLSSSQR